MCTLIVIKNLLRDSPLVLAANRDEAYARPWTPPQADAPADAGAGPRVWRPVDLAAGGTWVGVNDVRMAVAVTNRRPVPPAPDRRSRGLLCADILRTRSVAAACDALAVAVTEDAYNDFNMVVAGIDAAFVLHHEAGRTRTLALPDGVHVLSNFHDLDAEVWQPTRRRLTDAASAGWSGIDRALRAALASHVPADDGHLTCKHGEHYGTLCSSIIRMEASGTTTFLFAGGAPCRNPFNVTPLT